MGKNFLANIILGGKISPTLKNAFSSMAKSASKYASVVQKVNASAANVSGKLSQSLSTVGNVAKKVAVVGGAVGTAAVLGSKAILDQAGKLEQYKSTLNVVMKDQDKAAKTFKWAVDFANKTPFETDEIVDATVKLTSYGVEAQKTLPLIGDMAGVMGKSMDQAVEAVVDAQTGELERLKEFGITKEMIVAQGAKKLAGIELVNNKGQITNQRAFNAAMFSLMQERYKGGMEIQSKTYSGLMFTVSGIWKNGLARIAGIADDGTIIKGSMFDVIKEKVAKLSDILLKMQQDGTFEKIQKKVGELVSNGFSKLEGCLPSVINFMKKILDNAPVIFDSLKDGASAVADLATKAIDIGAYLLSNGPSINDIISFIGKAFLSWKAVSGMANVITTISNISKAIKGLEIAHLAVAKAKLVDKLETVYLQGLYLKDAVIMGAKTVATWAMAAAQGALNLAMTVGSAVGTAFGAVLTFLTSPIMLVVLAIAAVIGVLYLLYQNWDSVCNFMVGIWQNYVMPFFSAIGEWFSGIWNGVVSGFKAAWEGVTEWFRGLWDGIVSVAKGAANLLIAPINWLIRGLNSISIKVPDWIPDWLGGGKTFGISIPEIPTFAKGGFTNTPSIFGEAGPEAAIPLKRKNPRSISLLNETARKLGVEPMGSGNVNIVYSPQIHSNDRNMKQVLEEDFERFKQWLDEYFNDKDRGDF